MEVIAVFKLALMITFFVFVMMLLMDFIDTASSRNLSDIMKVGHWRQYTLASFLGCAPGCPDAFMNVSFYVHGMISFGALVGGMIATSGDEAFVMLAQFPEMALVLFLILFVSGILFAWLSDKLLNLLRIVPCEPCLEAQCEHCETEANNPETIANLFKPAILSLTFTRFHLPVFFCWG